MEFKFNYFNSENIQFKPFSETLYTNKAKIDEKDSFMFSR